MLKVISMVTGPLGTNTYIFHDDSSADCVIIDPASYERVDAYLKDAKLKPTHILLTHGHFDHILAVAALQREYGTNVCIHEAEAEALSSDKINLAAFVGTSVEKCTADSVLHDGDMLNLADVEVRVMHTPGHSLGSVCYILESEKVIFSGDTLFYMSVGRTDLYRSSQQDLEYSILYKLYRLHGDYQVLPGHGEPTSLEYERTHNPVTGSFNYD